MYKHLYPFWSHSSWTKRNPGLIVILLDTSELMSFDLKGTSTLLSAKAIDVINKIVDSLIQLNYNGNRVSDRCFIKVIGYASDTKHFLSGFLSTFDQNPKRVEVVRKTISDGAGGFLDINHQVPIWIDPFIGSGVCDLVMGLNAAKDAIVEWSLQRQTSAPIIINIIAAKSVHAQSQVLSQKYNNSIVDIVNELKYLKFTNQESPHIVNIVIPDAEDDVESTFSLLRFCSSIIPDEFVSKHGLKSSYKKFCIFTPKDMDYYNLVNWFVFR